MAAPDEFADKIQLPWDEFTKGLPLQSDKFANGIILRLSDEFAVSWILLQWAEGGATGSLKKACKLALRSAEDTVSPVAESGELSDEIPA